MFPSTACIAPAFAKIVDSAPKAAIVLCFQQCLYKQHNVRKGKCVTREQSATFRKGSDAMQFPSIFILHAEILSATVKLHHPEGFSINLKITAGSPFLKAPPS